MRATYLRSPKFIKVKPTQFESVLILLNFPLNILSLDDRSIVISELNYPIRPDYRNQW